MFRNGFQQHLVFQLRFKMALTNEAEILQNFRIDQYVNLCDYNFIYLLSIFVLMVMSLKKLESISCVHLITILSLSQPLLYLEKADLLTELRRVFTWNLWLIFLALGKVVPGHQCDATHAPQLNFFAQTVQQKEQTPSLAGCRNGYAIVHDVLNLHPYFADPSVFLLASEI